MRTLGGRIAIVLLVFALATLLAIGGSLWIALRGLHRDAAIGSLTELTVPYSASVRGALSQRVLRPGPGSERNLIDRLRTAIDDDEDAEELEAFRVRFGEEVSEADVSVILTVGGDSIIFNPEEGGASQLREVPRLDRELSRGQVATGTTEIEGIGEVLYATTPIIAPGRGPSAPFIMLARPDDSAQRATADLVRALSIAGLVLVLVGVPLALGLSRSVTRPLRRLADATGDVARGKVPDPLPVSGPLEVAEASAAFNTMASEVGATREAQRQLLADIRHDLRTPLTVIGGFSEALKDGTASGEVALRAADAIADETARLGRMLDDLDHLTVPGMAGPSMRPEPLDGLEVARQAVERFAAEAESRGQELRLAADARRTPLMADRDALDRILGNVIANALTHSPSPGGHVEVEVWSDGSAVTLAVRDDGPGIPASALPHVFDRFYRADPSRSGAGSGLGLAIVRDLADALRGHAFAENLDGQGARVGVTLPATTSDHSLPAAE